MKLIWNLGLVLLFCLAGMTTITAQGKAKGKKLDPQQRTEKQTAHMQKTLDLDEAQTAKVQAINSKYAAQKAAARAEKQQAKETHKAMRAKQDAELKAVLNKEQLAKYEALKTERKEKHGKLGHSKKGMKSEGGVKYSNPKSKTERATERMKQNLDLTPEQTDKVRALNFKYAKRIEAYKQQNPEATREDMKAAMKSGKAEQNAELKTILTKEQIKKWKETQAKRQEMREKKKVNNN